MILFCLVTFTKKDIFYCGFAMFEGTSLFTTTLLAFYAHEENRVSRECASRRPIWEVRRGAIAILFVGLVGADVTGPFIIIACLQTIGSDVAFEVLVGTYLIANFAVGMYFMVQFSRVAATVLTYRRSVSPQIENSALSTERPQIGRLPLLMLALGVCEILHIFFLVSFLAVNTVWGSGNGMRMTKGYVGSTAGVGLTRCLIALLHVSTICLLLS